MHSSKSSYNRWGEFFSDLRHFLWMAVCGLGGLAYMLGGATSFLLPDSVDATLFVLAWAAIFLSSAIGLSWRLGPMTGAALSALAVLGVLTAGGWKLHTEVGAFYPFLTKFAGNVVARPLMLVGAVVSILGIRGWLQDPKTTDGSSAWRMLVLAAAVQAGVAFFYGLKVGLVATFDYQLSGLHFQSAVYGWAFVVPSLFWARAGVLFANSSRQCQRKDSAVGLFLSTGGFVMTCVLARAISSVL